MSRRRFFVPQIRRGQAELAGEDAEHLVRVLRAEVGQVYEISDNDSLFLARITLARKSLVEFDVIEELPVPAVSARTSLLVALFKFDRLEWLIEKATELGVDEIIPFESERSEHGLSQASHKRLARWQKIAMEASQQSRRIRLPLICDTIGFEAAVAIVATFKIFLDEDATAPILTQLARPMDSDSHCAILLGPEGGWTSGERSFVVANGWHACSLGTTILRSETAGMAALAIVRALILGKSSS